MKTNNIEQGWATGGPWATSGPKALFICYIFKLQHTNYKFYRLYSVEYTIGINSIL